MNTDIHRLLDEAFQGVEMTPDAQDLKEEVRANLIARVDELEASGSSPAEAARLAIAELGDVRDLLDGGRDAAAPAAPESAQAAFLRHRVRPKSGFVVRTVVLSLIAAVALVLLVLGAFAIVPVGTAGLVALGLAVSLPLGIVTADALRQETTTNHPLPTGRAVGFGLATFGGLEALALGAVFAVDLTAVGVLVVAALLLVASIVAFSWLAATQTNRKKAWTRAAWNLEVSNRFEDEPETAARFGIYTAVIWIVTFAVIVLLIFTVGWWWGLLAFVGGFAVMMLVLANMMFGARRKP
ncbi:permease prefix domain 1-containing protein [Microbacterium sp. AZCO]|uniref:permease prefix domain 1-containing protein n=1 Tax=Microbacterium sp. AZCO TaxID=3142976 RepID=UPI0031F3E0C1